MGSRVQLEELAFGKRKSSFFVLMEGREKGNSYRWYFFYMLNAGKVRNESDSLSFPEKFNTMYFAK